MGSWFKFVNKRETKRLKAPVTARTAMAPAEVEAVLLGIEAESKAAAQAKVAAMKQKSVLRRAVDFSREDEHYHVYPTNSDHLVSYPFAAENQNRIDAVWVASVQIVPDGSGSLVTVQLARWVESDGELNNKDGFLRFLDQLARQLGGEALA